MMALPALSRAPQLAGFGIELLNKHVVALPLAVPLKLTGVAIVREQLHFKG
jgi:hypothetical protein